MFRLTDHMARLHDSAKLMMMEIPYSVEELVEATKETIRANAVDSCYIRPIAFLGYGEMGLNPLPCPVNVSIAVWPWGTYLGDEGVASGVRMKISTWRRMDPNINPVAAKGTGIYVNSSLAKVEALKGGYDEAILLNTNGDVSEATGENLFVVTDGVLRTPPLSSGALEGITRDSVMTIARDLGYEVQGRAAAPHRPLPRRRGVPHRHRGGSGADPRGRRPGDRRARRDDPQAPRDVLRRRARRGREVQRLAGICYG